MIFLLVNAVLSAIFFLVVVLPPLYIYNPDTYPGESNGPPSAGEVIPDDDVTHAVKQKLYLLFIIPTCATVNAIFLYFAYYRPIRFIHYRVELNLLTLRLTLDAGRQQIQKSGVPLMPNRSGNVQNLSILGANTSMISRNFSKAPGRTFLLDGNESSRQKLASSVNWEWRRHARPKSVRRDAWVNSAVFAEISELRDEIEQRFLLEGSVADANYVRAVVKTIGAFVPATTSTIMETSVPVAKAETQQRGFYNSSRPPLMSLGARTAPSGRVSGGTGGAMRGPQVEHVEMMPQRADSVVMVPTESGHRRGSGGGMHGAGGGGGGGSSALRFFKGGSHHRSGSSSGGGGTGNRLEQNPSAQASPTRRTAFEPLTVSGGGNSPPEPANGDTAVRGSHGGDAAYSGDEGGAAAAAAKPGFFGRMWGRGEAKEA